MFSGAGVFADGVMIAIIIRDVIYLRADAQTVSAFEAAGTAPFSYGTKEGERRIGGLWRMPDALYDDADELARWARDALAAAQRAALRKRGKAGRRSPAKPVKTRSAATRSKPGKRPSAQTRSE